MHLGRILGRFAVAVLALLVLAGVAAGQEMVASRSVVVLSAIEGAIGPAIVRHVEEVIETANIV